MRKEGINIAAEFQNSAEIRRFVWDAIYIAGLHQYPRDFAKLPLFFPRIGRISPSGEFDENILLKLKSRRNL